MHFNSHYTGLCSEKYWNKLNSSIMKEGSNETTMEYKCWTAHAQIMSCTFHNNYVFAVILHQSSMVSSYSTHLFALEASQTGAKTHANWVLTVLYWPIRRLFLELLFPLCSPLPSLCWCWYAQDALWWPWYQTMTLLTFLGIQNAYSKHCSLCNHNFAGKQHLWFF